MNKEVEILKIGSIIPGVISKLKSAEGKKDVRDTIMVVHNGGTVFDHYVSILKEKCVHEYKYLKTQQSIVGSPEKFRSSLFSNEKVYTIKGIQTSPNPTLLDD